MVVCIKESFGHALRRESFKRHSGINYSNYLIMRRQQLSFIHYGSLSTAHNDRSALQNNIRLVRRSLLHALQQLCLLLLHTVFIMSSQTEQATVRAADTYVATRQGACTGMII